MRKLKERQGITLIALVVTIVVLLILAGITIGAITGNNGIINQAQNAKNDTEYSQWEEQIDVAIIYAEGKHRNPTMDDVKEELKNKGIIDEYNQVDDKTGAITTNEPSYVIEGKLDDYIPFGPGRGYAKKNETYNDGTNTAIIPEGFKISDNENEQIINDGLVIEDKTGNQFVWIPVTDINNMAQCSTAGGDCKVELQGDTLKCTTHNSEEIVGKLFATTYGENFGTENTTYNANNGLREPAIVTGSSSGTGAIYDGAQENLDILEYKTSTDMLNDLKAQYKEMATSVAKNGGFYIGRYELGLEGTIPVSKNASTTSGVETADASKAETNMWYGLYKKCKEYTPQDSNSVVSTMTWGSQYDSMMKWMQNNDNGNGNGVNVTSVDTTKQNNSNITGNNTNDVIRNVYDLYACHREWTLETYGTDGRITRGGRSEHSDSPSYRNYNNSDGQYSYISARLTLYIK